MQGGFLPSLSWGLEVLQAQFLSQNSRCQSDLALIICRLQARQYLVQLLHCGPANYSAAGKMLVHHKTASSSAAVARGVSSSRVRPFTAAANRSSKAQQKQQRLVARAAEQEEQPEAEVEEVPVQAIAEEEFVFSLSEAKKVCRNALWAGGMARYHSQC